MLPRIMRNVPMTRNVHPRAAWARRGRLLRPPAPERLEDRLLLAVGDLDPTFGNGGTAAPSSLYVPAPPTLPCVPTVVLAEGDGKFIATVECPVFGSNPIEVVARFNADGSPDPTFGNNGSVLVPGLSINTGANVPTQPILPAALDGYEIVLAGQIGGDVAVMRLNADGSADTTFGHGGTAITSLSFEPTGVLIQGDGKILVGGPGDGGSVLARFNADGSLDTGFGNTGEVVSDIATSSLSNSNIALQTDGKIVVAGSSSGHLAAARYNSDGSLDTTFGPSATGEVITSGQSAIGLVVQATGIIAVSSDDTLTRFTPNGSIDTTFTSPPSLEFQAFALAVQADRKILVAGDSLDGVQVNSTLVRYNADGTLDTTFGSNGVVDETPSQLQSRSGAFFPHFTSVVSDVDDTILAGYPDVTRPSGGAFLTVYKFGLARFNADGTLDTTFGTGGATGLPVNLPGDPNLASGSAVALQADGDIVVAGNVEGLDCQVARLMPDGTPDSSFGSGGVATIPLSTLINGADGSGVSATGVSILPNGQILVVGSGGGGNTATWLVRYNPDGTLDETFGTAGIVSLTIGEDAFAVQTDGKILILSDWGDIGLTRLNADGSLDAGFGDGGSDATSFADGTGAIPWAITVQSDGKILVDGATDDGSYFIARYNSDGSLDPSFGGSGLVRAQFLAGATAEATSIATQPNGQIIVSGDSYDGGTGGHDIALARYNADGTLDPSFGAGGDVIVASASLTAFNGWGNGLLIQPDGRIVVEAGGASGTAALLRFNADGSLDSSFGQGGIADGGPSAASEINWQGGIALQTDGNIVVGGLGAPDNPQGGPLAVTRFQGGYPVDPSTIGGPSGMLQTTINTELKYFSSSSVTLRVDSSDQVCAAVSAADGLTIDPAKPITVVIDLDGGTYSTDTQINAPAGLTIVIRNGTLVGGSPALVVDAGSVVLQSITLTNATDAPTVVVNGGSLTLRDSSVLSEGGYGQPAVLVTAGLLDLGTRDTPGGDTLNINGAGPLIVNTSGNRISTSGDTFTINGAHPSPSSLSGVVFADFNNDGQVDFGEQGDRGRDDHPHRHRLPGQPGQSQPDDRWCRYLCFPRPGAGQLHHHRDAAGRLYAGNRQRRHRRRDRLARPVRPVPRGGPRRHELQLRRTAGGHRPDPAGPDGGHRLLEQQEWPGPDQGTQRRYGHAARRLAGGDLPPLVRRVIGQ